MTDITDQDRRDAREWAEDVAETFKYDDEVPRETRAAVNYILATVDAPEPTLAEELRGWESIFRNEGRSVDANSMRTLAARAEQIEQERDAARAEVARTDSARTQNYGDGSTLAGFLQKCVNIAHNIAAEYPSRPVKDHVIDLRWAADYAGRVEQERDEARSEVERLTVERDRAKDMSKGWMKAHQELAEHHAETFEDAVPDGAVYATPAGRMSQIQHYTFRPASALPDPAGVPAGEAWIVEVEGERRTAVKDRADIQPWNTVNADGWLLTEDDEDVTPITRLVPAPRVITNADDLDRLPEGTIIRDNRDGIACQKKYHGFWETTMGDDYGVYDASTFGPITVLWEPGV